LEILTVADIWGNSIVRLSESFAGKMNRRETSAHNAVNPNEANAAIAPVLDIFQLSSTRLGPCFSYKISFRPRRVAR
jgi:hypothetical protein